MFELENNTKEIHVYFDTEFHEIDAVILGETLISMTHSIQNLASVNGEPPLKVKVKALENGSFYALLSIVTSFSESVQFLKIFTEHLKGLWELYMFLNGRPPKEVEEKGDKVRIQNHSGDINYFSNNVFNYYNTFPEPPLPNREALLLENKVRAIELRNDKKEVLTRVSEEHFGNFAPHEKIVSKEEEHIVEMDAELSIYRAVFGDFSAMWGFIYREQKINAIITDKIFLGKIKSGHPLKYGDKIRTILRVTKKFDRLLNAQVHKKYEIVRVIEYIPRNNLTQPEFKFNI